LIYLDVFHNFNKIIAMKRLLLFLVVFGLCLRAIGQEPETFNYQTIVHNSAGDPVASRIVSFRISILFGNAFDTVVYSEKHRTETDQMGLASLTIGSGTDKTGIFPGIYWGADKYFLKVELDSKGGTDYIDIGTTQILIMPYTLRPKNSDKISPNVTENTLLISRKYVGKFLDYRQTLSKSELGPNILWIKTSMENVFGKISAYGKRCDFLTGDKLYLKRTYYNPGGISGYWTYQIENDSSVFYRLTDFQHDRKIPVESWFK
jgi:hypothetical protein